MSNNCFYIDNERYYYDNFHCYMINNRIKAFFISIQIYVWRK